MTISKARQVLSSKDLRKKYLRFFEIKGHKIIPSASLIPENDPTVLFTAAGMHPLVPYLLGEKHPEGQKLANFQKCIRTGDIDEVGNSWHLTFFEMLGNWSLSDLEKPDGIGAGYFKKEAIEMSWEFLTSKEWLGLDPDKIYISVFGGDQDAPRDEESAQIWQKVGIPKKRIFYYGKEQNWWGPAGQTGPCGPDTEMYYDTGKPVCGPACEPKCNCGKYAEIWNDVFMEYNKTKEGKYEPLKQKNVDTGMGLERTAAVLNGFSNIYEIDIFQNIIKKIEELSGKVYGKNNDTDRSMRIIADHLRAATFILGDEKGIEPSNVERGYILRRLVRRAIRYGRMIGITETFTFKIAEVVISEMSDIYPELKKNKDFIIEQLVREEEKFNKTVEKGLKELLKIFDEVELFSTNIPIRTREFGDYKGLGSKLFYIFSTYGFPIELSIEEINNKRKGLGWKELSEIQINTLMKEFQKEFKKHQELSRTATEGRFKGGLADQSEQTAKLHTATHLLLAALRKVLGPHVFQKGSNITAERLRLDFSHPQKVTPEELKQVEDLVNEQIKKNLLVVCEEMSLEEAKERKAMGVFESKYGDKVKVYTINNFSREICGGPHVKNTGELGEFKIKKEEASSAGVRRIKAILK